MSLRQQFQVPTLKVVTAVSLQDEEHSYLSWAVGVVTDVMAKRIKTSPNDEIGLVFYGTVSSSLKQCKLKIAELEATAAAPTVS